MLNSAESRAALRGAYSDQPGSAYLFVVVIATMLVLVLSAADRSIFAILLPRIKTDLRLSDGAAGLLSGLPFALCFALFSIPAAWLGDTRIRRKIVVAVAVVVWSASTALCGMAAGFASLFLLRMGVGVGEAGGQPAALSAVTEIAPESWRRRIVAICGVGATFGLALGVGAGGWTATNIGWRATFVVMGAPGFVIALLYFLVLRERVRSVAARPPSNFFLEMKALFSSKPFLMVFIGSGFSTWLLAGIVGWMPTYLTRAYNISLTEIGGVLALITLVAGIVGPIVSGWIGDRLVARDARWPMRLCALFLLGAILAAAVLFFVHDKFAVYVLLAVFQILQSALGPLMFVAAQDAIPKLRTTGLAAMSVGAMVIGAFSPWAVGIVSDAFSPLGAFHSLRMGMLADVPVAIIGVIAFWAAGSFIERAIPTAVQSQLAD